MPNWFTHSSNSKKNKHMAEDHYPSLLVLKVIFDLKEKDKEIQFFLLFGMKQN